LPYFVEHAFGAAGREVRVTVGLVKKRCFEVHLRAETRKKNEKEEFNPV
jgi:hypothetical protein